MQQEQSPVENLNNQSAVLLKIAKAFADQLLSDIVLIVGNVRYPAHRVILCASSEVFQVMLMNPEWSECKESVIELKEDPGCCAVFPQFLKYLYVGQIQVSLETVMPLLSLADKYDIKDLVKLCVDFMLKHIAGAGTQGFLVSWLQYTSSFSYHQNLTNELQNFLKWNLATVAASKDFVDLDPNIMFILLQQNDLVIKNEISLFEIVETWLLLKKEQIDHEKSLTDEEKQDHVRTLIEEIMVHIRFPMMTPTELAQIILKYSVTLHKEFFVDRMAIGMSYHAGQNERCQSIRRSENGSLQFTPRLYTSDLFSFEMNITEFHNIENYTNFGACFFSQSTLAESQDSNSDESSIQWEIDLFPRGVRYNKAQLINVFNVFTQGNNNSSAEIPETVLKVMRLRVTCKANLKEEEKKFKIGVLICAIQNQMVHIKTLHQRTHYFSTENRVLNIDNLLPYDELTSSKSLHLIGPKFDSLRLFVTIAPMSNLTCQESPPFNLS